MLAQLAARVSATRLPPGDGEEGEGEGGTVILDENCAVSGNYVPVKKFLLC